MIYKLKLKKGNDVKTRIDAVTKNAAICYFASLLHLSKTDLLKIYTVK